MDKSTVSPFFDSRCIYAVAVVCNILHALTIATLTELTLSPLQCVQKVAACLGLATTLLTIPHHVCAIRQLTGVVLYVEWGDWGGEMKGERNGRKRMDGRSDIAQTDSPRTVPAAKPAVRQVLNYIITMSNDEPMIKDSMILYR